MTTFSKIIEKAPKLTLTLILIITAFFAYFAPQVGITTDVKDFFPANHPEVLIYNEIEAKFGGAEYIMVAMTASDIFTYENLLTLRELSTTLERVEGVGQVRSLTSVDDVQGSEWGIELAPLIAEIPKDAAKLSELKEEILQDPMYSGGMVAPTADAALMVVEVKPQADSVLVAEKVGQIIEESPNTENLYLTGTPVLNQVLANSMKADLSKLFPIVLLLIAGVLYLNFKNLQGVLLPFSTVLISVIWTLGLMGMLGKQLSPLNAVMPVILVSLGSAYGIYILERYQEELVRQKTRTKAAIVALISVGVAVLMAGTTTIAGFASNLTSSISLMKDFGLFTAFGILVALGVSLTLIPAVLILRGSKKDHRATGLRKNRDQNKTSVFLERGLEKMARFVTGRSALVIVIVLVLAGFALSGLPRLETDSNFFNFFDDGSKPKLAYELVKDKFSGSQSVEVVLKGDLQEPKVLQAMAAFQNDLEATGLVGKPTSIVNLLEKVNSALNDGKEEYTALPDSRELVAQYLLLLEMNDEQGMVSRFLTMDYQEGRIQALVKDSSSAGTTALFEEINNLTAKHFEPLQIEATPTGIIVLMNSLAEMIIQGQISSLIFSLVTVFIIVRLLLKSWEGSILSILLILLTTLINFGLMGWLGIPLDIVTVLISSIGIGVGIDYSIHVYSRFCEEQKSGWDVTESLARTIRFTGKAIATNTGSVVAGFVILVFSSFPPLRYFGSLVTATMLVASLGSLTLLPAVIVLRNKRHEKQYGKAVVK